MNVRKGFSERMVRRLSRMPMEAVELLALEALVLRDVVLWAILVLAEWLNILQVFSGLHDSIVVCK